jgi:hypothetical protein
VFTYVIDCFGDGECCFPSGSTMSTIDEFIERLRSDRSIRSIEWMLKVMSHEKILEQRVAGNERFTREIGDALKRRQGEKLNTQRVRTEQRKQMVRDVVIPEFFRIMLELHEVEDITMIFKEMMGRFDESNGKGGPEQLEKLCSYMPSLELFSQLVAARAMNPTRKVKPQDFWDMEHARIAPVYADAFVTADKGLVNLLASRCCLPRERGCNILRTPSALMEQLANWGCLSV